MLGPLFAKMDTTVLKYRREEVFKDIPYQVDTTTYFLMSEKKLKGEIYCNRHKYIQIS